MVLVKTPLKRTTLKKKSRIKIANERDSRRRILHNTQTKRGSQKSDAMSFSPSKARRLFSPRGGRHAGYGSRGHDSSTTTLKEGTKTEDDGAKGATKMETSR